MEKKQGSLYELKHLLFQRYFTNNATYRAGGPVFLMLGGETEVNPAWLVDGAWQQYARAYGAFLVLLEHRYYGKSRPVE